MPKDHTDNGVTELDRFTTLALRAASAARNATTLARWRAESDEAIRRLQAENAHLLDLLGRYQARYGDLADDPDDIGPPPPALIAAWASPRPWAIAEVEIDGKLIALGIGQTRPVGPLAQAAAWRQLVEDVRRIRSEATS